MDIEEHETPWIKRVEELIQVLEGSTIGELELTEAGTEIIIRRKPNMMISVPCQQVSLTHPRIQATPGNGIQQVPPEQERELLTFLKRMEHYLIEHAAIQAVGFRYVGNV